ncbi:hypothetical protein BDQ17DRAFT_1420814 [Cyathus striatus]|nr:hypothetical protein BDQ17DRAFT_1420814 [Cyathus striatus]
MALDLLSKNPPSDNDPESICAIPVPGIKLLDDLKMEYRSMKEKAVLVRVIKDGESKLMDISMKIYTSGLKTLPWNGILHGFKRQEPIKDLMMYASRNWFSTSHEDQMVNILIQELQHHHASDQIELKTTVCDT